MADLSGAWETDWNSPLNNDWWNEVQGDVLSISYNPTGVSSFSFPPTGSPAVGLDYPAAPTNVVATTGGAVSWTAVPNQDVSSDTTLGLGSFVRAQYLIFRQTLVAGVGTGWACVGTTLPTGYVTTSYGDCPIGGNEVSASPPPTSFVDTSIVAGTTYEYAVVAVSNDVNTLVYQLDGPPSAPSAPVTIPTSTSTAGAPVSTNAAWAPITNSVLVSGTSLTVDFNEPVTLTVGSPPSWDLYVSDAGGDSAVVNAGDGSASVQAGPAGPNTAILYTLTSSPQVIAGLDPVLSGMEITGETGVTATGCTAAECAWNIIGSGPSTGNPSVFAVPLLSRTFQAVSGTQNAVLSESPYVSSETAPNSLVVTCEDGPGSINVYDANGVSIGGGTCGLGAVTVTTTTPFASGAALYVSQSVTPGGDPESLATFTGPVLTFSPTPIAPADSLGNNQGVTVTATVTTLTSPDPNASVDLEFVSTATIPGTASVAGTTLLPTAQSFTTNASGQIAIHYTASPQSVTLLAGIDTIESNGFGVTDTYNYVGAPVITFLTGPGITAGESPTADTTPTWTGTATSPVGDTISNVSCWIDGGAHSDAALTYFPGPGASDSANWTWTAPANVINGPHSIVCTAKDSPDGYTTSTAALPFVEDGEPLLITSATTDPGTNSILVTFNGPVTCPNTALDDSAWSFTNTYTGPGAGVVGTASPTSITTGSLASDSCSLNFPAIDSNDYGPLAYTEPALAVNQVVGNPGPALASNPVTAVADATAPTLASVASVGGTSTVTLTYTEWGPGLPAHLS